MRRVHDRKTCRLREHPTTLLTAAPVVMWTTHMLHTFRAAVNLRATDIVVVPDSAWVSLISVAAEKNGELV